jgi:hypothetical protein
LEPTIFQMAAGLMIDTFSRAAFLMCTDFFVAAKFV